MSAEEGGFVKRTKIKRAESRSKFVVRQYKRFYETYSICGFALALSGMYPNKSMMTIRWFFSAVLLLTSVPILYSYAFYICKCVMNKDVITLTRQITMGIMAALYLFKLFYVTYKTNLFKKIIDVIDEDLLKANDLDESYQDIYDAYIKIATLGQSFWIANVLIMSFIFPVLSGAKMAYGYLVENSEKKYMIHDMEIKYVIDKQYDSPYFEIIWMYMGYIILLWIPNFMGFDGTFCISTAHIALKMKLVAHKLKLSFENSSDIYELRRNIKSAIKDHQNAIHYYNLVQSLHSSWLFIVFVVTSISISLNLYQVSEGNGVETKYAILTVICAIHAYIPCHFASILREVGNNLPIELYSCGWENWLDPVSNRMVTFMVARAQKPLILTAQGFIIFDMELFVSLIKSSYSFYALLKD